MDILHTIYEKAKQAPKVVAFPEAENEKVMQAAYETTVDGYIRALLVGDVPHLKQLCEERGYDPEVFQFEAMGDASRIEELVTQYTSLPGTLLGPKGLTRRMADPLTYCLVLEALGVCDVTFAGIDYPTGDVILAGQTIVGLQEGISTISSIGIFDIPGYEGSEGQYLVFGDSAVCQNPTAEQLSDIAISACNTVRTLLDWEPRCALVSYSTLGSGTGELLDKVIEAAKIAREKRPDLAIEGEFQLDAAIDPEVAKKKVQTESRVAGRANIVIWPDLNVGNVGVKLVQQFAHADAYGPMLQGFRKVVCDCSRGAPVSELKGNIVISAVRAAGME